MMQQSQIRLWGSRWEFRFHQKRVNFVLLLLQMNYFHICETQPKLLHDWFQQINSVLCSCNNWLLFQPFDFARIANAITAKVSFQYSGLQLISWQLLNIFAISCQVTVLVIVAQKNLASKFQNNYHKYHVVSLSVFTLCSSLFIGQIHHFHQCHH